MNELENKIVMLPIGRLHPHPDNPRKDLGDLSELAESIRVKGVLQNLTVVPHDGDYRIIIGHRRRAAAEVAGLTHLPCAIVEMSPLEQVNTMLLENLQRADLTVYEQAQGFQMMIDMGDTPEGIAEKTGFSKKTVRRRLEIAKLDQATLKKVSGRQISLFDFDELSKIEDIGERNEVLKTIGTSEFKLNATQALLRQKIRKMEPLVEKLVKRLKAKRLKDSERWKPEYSMGCNTIFLQDWDGVSCPVSADEKRQIYYHHNPGDTTLTFFFRDESYAKAAAKAKIPPEMKQKIAQANADLAQITSTHFMLRQNFISDFRITKANQMQVLKAAIYAFAASKFFFLSINAEVKHMFGNKDVGSDSAMRLLDDFTQKIPEKDYVSAIYKLLADGPEANCALTTEIYFPAFVTYKTHVIFIYDFLKILGYELSNEEATMLDGTHEIYHRGDKA